MYSDAVALYSKYSDQNTVRKHARARTRTRAQTSEIGAAQRRAERAAAIGARRNCFYY
jgi:hypothetical protein